MYNEIKMNGIIIWHLNLVFLDLLVVSTGLDSVVLFRKEDACFLLLACVGFFLVPCFYLCTAFCVC